MESSAFVFVLLWCVFIGVESLRDVKVEVPKAIRIHTSVALRCSFDLEGDPLYTVKWYKGRREIFRFVPKEDPNMLIFPLPGVDVDLSRSSENEIHLLDVQPEASGKYLCEVSTDAPEFFTISSSGIMYVVDIPDGSPIVEINKQITGQHNVIKANCTTPPSFPAMNVTWYLNGIKIPESARRSVSLDPVKAFSKTRPPPYMTISYIEKEVDDNIFQDGVLKIQCVGKFFDLYEAENVRYVEDNRLQPWPSSVIGPKSFGTRLLFSNRTCVITFLGLLIVMYLQTERMG